MQIDLFAKNERSFTMSTNHKPLAMKIELTVIEDLGIKLYSHLPQVLSEVVANAWDANASSVEIFLQEGDIDENSTIVVKDNGHGMTYEDIQDMYLRVGRKKRVENGTDETLGGQRKAMGRKGIGKLAVFGVAKQAEIKTVRNGKLSVFHMDVDDMLREAHESGTYVPKSTCVNEYVNEHDGTTITLTKLTRKSRIDTQAVRRGIAKHFSVIGNKFQVSVNGEQITASDKFVDKDWEKKWPIDELVNEEAPEWRVSGWIGATVQPLDEEDRGLIITARGKLIQSSTMFGIKSGSKYAYSYIAGEIQAEFCDMEYDSIATDRHAIMETPQGIALMEWGASKISKIADMLTEMRKCAREKTVREDPEIKKWLSTLDGAQTKTANKVIRIVTLKADMGAVERKELVRYARASFEHSAFLEMVSTLDEHPDPAMLLKLFKECNMVEAREIERIVKSRLEAIHQLTKFIDENALEVPTLHDYFKDSPWMLDPTWTQWQHEVHYSKLLRDKFPDEELDGSDRRIDFLSIGVGDTVHVIELKRPQYTVRSKDFTQLADYVGFIKNRIGNDPDKGYRDVAGYLVVGKRSDSPGVKEMVLTFEKSRHYVRTYDDLVSSAQRLHKQFVDKLEEFETERRQST